MKKKIVVKSPKLTLKPYRSFFSTAALTSWICRDRVMYHLGVDNISPEDTLWLVASNQKPKGHSSWDLKDGGDATVLTPCWIFIDDCLAKGCRWFWLELEHGK